MSEENKPHNEDNSDSIPDGADINSFFEGYNPEGEDSERSNENSRKEKFSLFGGDLTDIEAFLKHEEVRLKFYEFKLKKKTQVNDNRSKFKDSKNERKLRRENAKKAFWFSSIWAVFIAIFIILHAVKNIKLPFFTSTFEFVFDLEQAEFIFVCGTLTASILIFYLTVIKNLFPNKPDASIRNNIENHSE